MNSLRVDVILETEQRSTSLVNVRFVLKVAGGLFLAALAGIILYSVWDAKSNQRRKGEIEAEWDARSKVAERIRQDTNDLYQYTNIYAEIEGWRTTRILWHQHLADFQALVPANIQITSFQTDESTEPEGKGAVRKLTLNLQGRAEGDNPKAIVEAFLASLQHGPGFSNLVGSAAVEKIDTVPGDKTSHRRFTIAVKYKPRSL